MLAEIWTAIGLLVGYMILIPLLIFVAVLIVGCIKGMFDLAIKAGKVVAEWIDEKIHTK